MSEGNVTYRDATHINRRRVRALLIERVAQILSLACQIGLGDFIPGTSFVGEQEKMNKIKLIINFVYLLCKYSTEQCSTVQYSKELYSTVQNSTEQYIIVQYSTVLRTTPTL